MTAHPPILPSVANPPAMYAKAKPRVQRHLPRATPNPEDTAPPFRWTGELPQWIDSDVFQINGAWYALQVYAAPVTGPPSPPPAPPPGGPPKWLGLQTVPVNGQLYALQLYLLPVAGGPPNPPPPPPPTGTITGVTTWNALPLTAGRGGDFVLINGTGFGSVKGTVTVAGLSVPIAEFHRWTDTQLALFLPADPGPDVSGPIVVTAPGQAAITSPFAFTIAGTGPAPRPNQPPFVGGYQDGSKRSLSSLPPGVPVIIKGSGFGSAAGRLLWRALPLPWSLWTDTEIDFTTPAEPDYLPAWMTIMAADGRYSSEDVRGRGVKP